MTQRQLDSPQPLPRCKLGHQVRYMLDARCAKAGGGHFIECRCCATRKHPTFDLAFQDWRRLNGLRTPRVAKPAGDPAQHILQLSHLRSRQGLAA